MTRGGAIGRYCMVSILLIAVQLASLWFHSAGVYQGGANVPLNEFPEDVDVFYILTFAPTIVGLKYLLYDFAVRALTQNYRTPALRFFFFAGYAGALMFDMMCLFSSSKPVADAGLAILGTIIQSPLILIASGGVIAATVLLKDRPPQTGATPSSGR
jgi:hypothetical protein